jgi:anti-sigma factor RsiW
MTPEHIAHETAFELLPWLVNGRLEGTEREAVEAHVRGCLLCHRELKEQRGVYAAIRSEHAGSASAERAFAVLERKLDEPPRRRTAGIWRSPLILAAAAAAALVAVGLWLAPASEDSAPRYTTLTAPSVPSGAQIDIVFAEQTTAAEIASLLDAVNGEIVAGPNDIGRYGVRIGDGTQSAADIEKAVRQLRNDSRVRFAARVVAEPER